MNENNNIVFKKFQYFYYVSKIYNIFGNNLW